MEAGGKIRGGRVGGGGERNTIRARVVYVTYINTLNNIKKNDTKYNKMNTIQTKSSKIGEKQNLTWN